MLVPVPPTNVFANYQINKPLLRRVCENHCAVFLHFHLALSPQCVFSIKYIGKYIYVYLHYGHIFK